MITVNIKKDDSFISDITIKGHAGFAVYGKDIVCAAVSSSVITTVNAIISFDETAIAVNEDSGYLRIKVLKNDNITNKLLVNLEDMLKSLIEQYPKNIKII